MSEFDLFGKLACDSNEHCLGLHRYEPSASYVLLSYEMLLWCQFALKCVWNLKKEVVTFLYKHVNN